MLQFMYFLHCVTNKSIVVMVIFATFVFQLKLEL